MSIVKRFTVLDSFRGLFAFVVAIYHYKAAGPVGRLSLFEQGDYFVDFFFVLSGFIIYHNYSNLSPGKSQFRFMENRLYRLYPLHLIMLLAFLVMETVKYGLYERGLFKSEVFGKSNLTTFMYNVFFMQSFSQTSAGWNYPSWSISAEMFTYLVFCLLIVYRKQFAFHGRIVSFCIISLCSLALIYVVNDDFDIKMTTNFSMLRCMYGFFAGCIVYEVYRQIIEKEWVKALSFTALELVVLVGSLLMTAYMPQQLSFLLPIAFCLCILIFSMEGGKLSKYLNNRLLGKIGELSYSIYMTHAAIAIIFEIVLGILKIKSPVLMTVALIGYLVTIFQVSRITNHYIEIKLRKWLQSRLGSKKIVLPTQPVTAF